MTIKVMIQSTHKIYSNSKKNIHLIILLFAGVINGMFVAKKISISDDDKLSILTGISLLASLFLLAVEKIDFQKINNTFTNLVKISKNKETPESVVIRNTVFSLSLTTFLLIGICFMLKIFNIEYVYLLILVICYLFFGIIYTIILWNYTLSKQGGHTK